MSGGSFEYLCNSWDMGELAQKYSSLTEMHKALREYAPDHPATAETKKLVRLLNANIPAPLRDVWQAMEWWKSCDWSEDELVEALADFEKKK